MLAIATDTSGSLPSKGVLHDILGTGTFFYQQVHLLKEEVPPQGGYLPVNLSSWCQRSHSAFKKLSGKSFSTGLLFLTEWAAVLRTILFTCAASTGSWLPTLASEPVHLCPWDLWTWLSTLSTTSLAEASDLGLHPKASLGEFPQYCLLRPSLTFYVWTGMPRFGSAKSHCTRMVAHAVAKWCWSLG